MERIVNECLQILNLKCPPWTNDHKFDGNDFIKSFKANECKPVTCPFIGSQNEYMGSDAEVRMFNDKVGLKDKVVLELGCWFGYNTAWLARYAKKVIASDIRPRNLVKTMALCMGLGLENVEYRLLDARKLTEEYGHFDVLWHRGVLYHMSNPIEHLFNISKVADWLLLNTHYSNTVEGCYEYNGHRVRFSSFGESGWGDDWSGVEDNSKWIYKQDLIDILEKLGYENITMFYDNPSWKRFALCASV